MFALCGQEERHETNQLLEMWCFKQRYAFHGWSGETKAVNKEVKLLMLPILLLSL